MRQVSGSAVQGPEGGVVLDRLPVTRGVMRLSQLILIGRCGRSEVGSDQIMREDEEEDGKVRREGEEREKKGG